MLDEPSGRQMSIDQYQRCAQTGTVLGHTAARGLTALGMIRFCHVSSSTVGTMALITERLSEVCEQYDALYSRWNTLDESQMATVTCANAPAWHTQAS